MIAPMPSMWANHTTSTTMAMFSSRSVSSPVQKLLAELAACPETSANPVNRTRKAPMAMSQNRVFRIVLRSCIRVPLE